MFICSCNVRVDRKLSLILNVRRHKERANSNSNASKGEYTFKDVMTRVEEPTTKHITFFVPLRFREPCLRLKVDRESVIHD